ncbi:hypothetical protein [Plantactinospora endophytica]|nr:hypothetical protein [Plantactinospora endophytica]
MDRNDFGVHLRDRIGAETLPPSQISATGLVTEGRRVRRRRRYLSVGAGASTLAVLAGVVLSLPGPDRQSGPDPAAGTATARVPVPQSEAAASALCAGQRLSLPSGAIRGEVRAGSPDGRYLAGSYSTAERPVVAVRWDGDRVERIPVDGWASAEGVNDRGVVVGSTTVGKRQIAWAYVDGKVVELPVPAGYSGAAALGVNARGEVAGVLDRGTKSIPAVWRGTSADARVDVLPTPTVDKAWALGISESGAVAGLVGPADDAYRWDRSGRGGALARPDGLGRAIVQGVRGELAYGLAHSTEATSPPPSPSRLPDHPESDVGVLWDLGTGAVTVVGRGRVGAANSRGYVVLNRRNGGEVVLRAPDGRLRQLSTGINPSASAATLSEDGTRIGGRSREHWPIRWTCPS